MLGRVLLAILLLSGTAHAGVFNPGGTGSGGGVSIESGTDVPTSCTPGTGPNALFLDTDDEILYVCTSTDTFTSTAGSPEADTLQSVFARDPVITGADSLAHAVRIGDGTTPICLYTDSTLGPVIRPCTDSTTRTYIWTNQNHEWYDIEGNATMFTIDPDATDNNKYVWASGYRPIKTIKFTADSLYPRGSSTLVTDTALVSGGLVSPYLTTTDNDADGFYRYIVMDPNWDGGTVTGRITVVNTNGTPGNALVMHISGACYPAGTVIPTTISSIGEQAATVSFGSSGSCGASACDTGDPASSAATAAITLNGTPAGGNLCAFQAQTDASGTTETVAGIKIIQMDINYKLGKGF